MDDALPEVEGGWRWRPAAIPDVDPDAPLHELQRRMRIAEAELAEELATGELLTVLDGTLAAVRAPDVAIVGYVKTHHRALLAPDQHARVSRLRAGERTTLFQLHRQGLRGRPYSCYFRLADCRTAGEPVVRHRAARGPRVGRARARSSPDRLCRGGARPIRRCSASRPSGTAEPAADRSARELAYAICSARPHWPCGRCAMPSPGLGSTRSPGPVRRRRR